MRVQSLGQEDPLKKGMATCSSILTLKPYGPVAWWVTGHGVAKSRTRLSDWAHTRTQKIMRMILVSSLLAISEYSVGNMVEHVFKQADRWRILIFSSKTWKLSSLNTGGGSSVQFSSVQSLSHVRLFATPWIAARQASLSITNSQSLLKLMSIESVMSSSHLILCHPLLLLPPIPPSIRVFYNESTLHIRWPKYWSYNFSISPSNEHPGLISFRMDWLDLLAVQGTLKSLLQYHSSKASILSCSAFFTVQLSHPYMTTGLDLD